MEVIYTATREDAAKFCRDYHRYQRQSDNISRWWPARYYLMFFSVPGGVAILMGLSQAGQGEIFLTILAVGCIWPFVLNNALRKRQLEKLQNASNFNGTQTTRLDEDGVYHRNTFAEWKIFWASVKDVVLTKELMLIVSQRNSYIIVPRRAFDSNEQWHEFYNIAVARWKDGQAPTAE